MPAIIQKITLRIGQQTVECTKEEAKKVYEALHELFGQNTVFIDRPIRERREPPFPHWQLPPVTCEVKTPIPDDRPRMQRSGLLMLSKAHA